MSFVTANSRWRAVTTRDPAANGHFVYCVRSTGIYCRPTCGARLARRANLEFHATPTEAAATGFRPCKRCKPDLKDGYDLQAQAVEKACERISNRTDRTDGSTNAHDISLRKLADEVGWTPSYLHRVFKRKMGITPKRYADILRGQRSSCVNMGEIFPENGKNCLRTASVAGDRAASNF
ncbi:hypothetical protein V1520DRAFT_109694 [Lipomyces starkeyi]|uniref:HTH araC/xylS-type domain-containing protein n=1 Tax=Lipomyces starkeyi NRRL Y-11557 TaxID=675824 RepID=A0A1E3PV36_LIPST|nr:hypothetical protein LIPSTDRAFT_59735 [Lipomyces starkeyi NRRL Y-11557]